MSMRPNPPCPLGRQPLGAVINLPYIPNTSQRLRNAPLQQRVPVPIREPSPTSDENESKFPQPNNEHISQKWKFDTFADKAVLEWDSKSTSYDVLKPYQKSAKYFCHAISCVSNLPSVMRLGLKRDRKAAIAKAHQENQDVDDLPEEPEEPEEVDSDDHDDLDNDINEEVKQSAQARITRKLEDYSKFIAHFPKLYSRLLKTLEYDDPKTLNVNTIKGAVVAWLPYVWPRNVKVKTVKGSYDLPIATIDKSVRGIENKIIALFLCPHSRLKEAFGSSSAACIHLISELKNHQIQTLADGWPALLYDLNAFCASNKWKDYLHGKMLLYTVRTIFMLPTSALGQQNIKTRGGNAKLLGLSKVSPEMIAYSAVQLWFSLSNLQQYAKMDGLFNFEEFYHFILDSITKGTEKSKKWSNELFQWWDAYVFGDKPPQITTTTNDPFENNPDAASDNEIDADTGTDTEM
ncbi:hypothetical protein BT96DRAFT_988386 [Gymnopus androsaceus JB14]|uniref:Uncharacterized protein n=1 Tax=Gymnopus androsaceus JB14 TaxID=1447944 RepID=A0A6A4I6P4_9AGAR|nr:hypothetical protein BT96DRAFT_988386 [Gymnopus androsaceus JB14]